MLEKVTLARPYARAVFEVAREDQQLAEWAEMLATTAAIVTHPKVEQLLAAPGLVAQQKVDALVGVLSTTTPKQANFLATLAANDRLVLLPEIVSLFAQMKAQHEQTIDVDLRSAFDVPAELQQKLTKALTNRLKREVQLTTEVDSSLIGGVLIRAGDIVIDDSIKGRLARLTDSVVS